MTDMQITLEPAQKLIDLLNRAPDIVDKHIRKALVKSGLIVEREARENVAQATRGLMRSITSRVKGAGAEMHALVEVGEPYGWYVEHGRGPGKMPPYSAGSSLALWAKAVGITSSGSNPTRQDLGILFTIARSIGKHGTRAQPFLEPAFEESKPKIAGYFTDAIRDAIKEIEDAA